VVNAGVVADIDLFVRMRGLLLALVVVLTLLDLSLEQADNSPPEDAKTKRLGEKGENKKRDNKKVSKKMLKMGNETESSEDTQADQSADTGTGSFSDLYPDLHGSETFGRIRNAQASWIWIRIVMLSFGF